MFFLDLFHAERTDTHTDLLEHPSPCSGTESIISDDMKQLSNQVTQLQQVLNTRGFHLTKLSATDNKILSGINTTDCKITDPSDKLS